MAVFKCKMCGGSLVIKDGESTAVCEYCGTRQTLPRLDDERRANLYDRANHFRRNNEFDKAMSIYEQILNEDKTDAEAYWSIVLCRYGIEYVEDPSTQKRVPTVNRTQYASVFSDADYKAAVQYADGYQRDIYETEARAIDELQKGILAVSKNEKPFDVFICYKETGGDGCRTPDSVLAGELYHQLTQEGFKVFYSRVTLEDKLGSAYEPYIFAALNSAKVMVVLGTKPEFFNAAWVKNEWGRYLSLIKNGAKKTLIPAYKDMDPYDLPEEFSHLQAQDMSKLGFMQDLIRGVKKLAASEPEISPTVATVYTGGANTASLLKRAFIFLEDGEWQSADEYCEKVLDIDPENAEAYVGKLMAELHAKNRLNLVDSTEPLEKYNNCQKAIRFGDGQIKSVLEDYNKRIVDRNENARLEGIYKRANNAMHTASKESEFIAASKIFKTIRNFKDADTKVAECLEKAEIASKEAIYNSACIKSYDNTLLSVTSAISLFDGITGYKDSGERADTCRRRLEELKVKAEQERLEKDRRAEAKRIAAKKRRKQIKLIALIVLVAAAVIATIYVLRNDTPAAQDGEISLKAGSEQERHAFLSQFGWEVDEDPIEVVEIIIPNEFDEVYEDYNDIQKKQKLDLSHYGGKRVKCWTYAVKNYPGYEAKPNYIQANILVYKGRVIGGDICSVELNGFMHGFDYPESESVSMTESEPVSMTESEPVSVTENETETTVAASISVETEEQEEVFYEDGYMLSNIKDESVPAIAKHGEMPVFVNAKAAVLMDYSTGRVLMAMHENDKLYPASITKIMTLLLVAEAVDSGKLKLSDMITYSRNASSKGGSQIWLKEGETMSVDDLLKATAIYSANDACTALGEQIAGSSEAFVDLMNDRAKELGMANTNFVNCTGLDDDTTEHLTTAYDVVLMSRELLKHDFIQKYTTVWMGSLRGGQTELTNTNRLVRFYDGTTGLKTGTTSKAGCCISATAKRGDTHLIAVVMGSPSSNDRFEGAKEMLNWGFANYETVTPEIDKSLITQVAVIKGIEETIKPVLTETASILISKGRKNDITQEVNLAVDVEAPVEKGQVLGRIVFRLDNEIVGEYNLTAPHAIGRLTIWIILRRSWYIGLIIVPVFIVVYLIKLFTARKRKQKNS